MPGTRDISLVLNATFKIDSYFYSVNLGFPMKKKDNYTTTF